MQRESACSTTKQTYWEPELCDICLVVRPVRSRHCLDCNRCVRRFDHHCPWVYNCVGERNHRFYMYFLMSELVVLLWGVKVSKNAFVDALTWTEWCHINFLLLFSFVIMLFGTLAVIALIACHIFLISNGLTTWEFVRRHRISYLKSYDDYDSPFDEGLIKNFINFFFYNKERDWSDQLQHAYARQRGRRRHYTEKPLLPV